MDSTIKQNTYQTAPYFKGLQKQVIQFVDEEFKPIKGHENFLISNYGRVYSTKVGCILNEFENTHGYLQCNVDRIPMKIHRLVAEAFIPNPENKRCATHISGSKTNNHVSNIDWCSNSEYTKRSYDKNIEKPKIGENNGRALHTDEEVRQICSLLEQGLSIKEVSDKMGYDYPNSKYFLYKIASRESWQHITKDYNF